MPDESSEQPSENWISTIVEGGLPQIIGGPAGKAISRLIGAAVEVPASYIDGFVQGIKDKNSGKSLVAKAVAEQAAIMAVDDPEVMERALNSLLAKQYRGQKNKEEVAKIVIEDLNHNPPPSDSEGPSDDWMNKFERYAEDASSDELRMMYAKLLAGEIRKEKSVSAATLHFVSLLDGEVTSLIERVLPYTTSEGITFTDLIQPELSYVDRTILDQAGFWAMDKNLTLTHAKDGKLIYPVRSALGFYSEGPADHEMKFGAGLLSKAGRDLAKIINRDFEIVPLVKLVLSKGSTKAGFGEYKSGPSNTHSIQNMFIVTE